MDAQNRINGWVIAGMFLVFGWIFVSANNPAMPAIFHWLPYTVGAALIVFGILFHDRWIHRKHHNRFLHH